MGAGEHSACEELGNRKPHQRNRYDFRRIRPKAPREDVRPNLEVGGRVPKNRKNVGVPFAEIRERVMTLFGDVRFWIENNTYSLDEMSVRFHHRLALIHPFPNGNGRHARLIADVLAIKLGRSAFTWGSANLVKEGEARNKYLEVIRTADNGDIQPLLKFSRS